MKTTVEVPDNLYRQIKDQAALQGKTIKAFFLDALRDKLAQPTETADEEVGWRAVFGKGDKEALADLQRIIDEEHNKIDYESWGLPEPQDPS